MAGRDLVLPLNRPQYVPASEVLVSELVHRHFENKTKPTGIKGYRFLSANDNKKSITTGPSNRSELVEFGTLLRDHEMKTEADDLELAESIINGVTGVAATGAKSLPASPLTPHLALTQDLDGVLGVSAPDIGGALEAMYLMGAPSHSTKATMGELWLDAARQRMDTDPILRVIDDAFAQWGDIKHFEPKAVTPPRNVGPWIGRFGQSSPFSWLHDSWNKLMDAHWVDALPARVWTDWSTMILRTALAFGYLWEMRWYERVGRLILGEEPITSLPQNADVILLPWPPARLPVESRNVKREIRQTVSRGLEVREVVIGLQDRYEDLSGTAALEQVRQQREYRALVREAMSGRVWDRRQKNIYETIIYALQQRSVTATSTDYYGFLRPHGARYSVVAPGTEWIAVVASLSCPFPDSETHVGSVMSNLARIGLRPELQEIVRSLEAAGLAQGSADADHGVRVRSAF